MEKRLSFFFFLILSLLVGSSVGSPVGSRAIKNCPAECSCTKVNASSVVVCHSKNVDKMTRAIPGDSTHVLVYYIISNQEGEITLDFTPLASLKVLILDQENAYSSLSFKLSRETFPPSAVITKFASRFRTSINSDAFSSLDRLEDVSLSGTLMEWDSVPLITNRSLCGKKHLKRIALRRFSIQLTMSDHQKLFEPTVVFNNCTMDSVEILELSGNEIFGVKKGFSSVFPNLRVLDFSSNQLMASDFYSKYGMDLLLDIFINLQLHTIIAGDQSARKFEEQKFTTNDLLSQTEAPQPTLKCNRTLNQYILLKMILNNNFSLISDLCSSLEVFSVNSVESQSIHVLDGLKWSEFYFPMNTLRSVDVSSTDFSYNILGDEKDYESFCLPESLSMIKYLNIQSMGIPFFNVSMFNSLTSLKTLLLGGNKMGTFFSSLKISPFGFNAALEVLDLASCDLTSLPRDLVGSNTRLLRLSLHNNLIKNLDLSLDGLVRMVLLNISSNRIQSLNQTMREELDALVSNQDTPLTIDMTGNDLDCGCRNLDYVTWMQNTGVNIYGLGNLTCSHPFYGHVTLNDISVDELRSKCFPSVVKTVLVSVLSTFLLMMVLITVGLVYCKRWKLRNWWYITQKGWKDLVNQQDITQYDYDAFVAYDHRDINWVKRHLLVQMEEERHFKFCVHHRDFPGGQVLEEVIADSIQKSRKTIIVLSPEFVQSEWCQFELSMARNQLFDAGRDVVVAVILKPLQAKTISNTLYNVLRKKLYLEWVENDLDAQELFWRKLEDSLTVPDNLQQ